MKNTTYRWHVHYLVEKQVEGKIRKLPRKKRGSKKWKQ